MPTFTTKKHLETVTTDIANSKRTTTSVSSYPGEYDSGIGRTALITIMTFGFATMAVVILALSLYICR